MNFYIPWSLVTYLLGWASCIVSLLLLAKAMGKVQARKMTATQKKYKAVLDGSDLGQALDDLQKRFDAMKDDV